MTFSDSDSSQNWLENDEMESTSRNKVSAAPGTLEGHDSDNSSVKNSVSAYVGALIAVFWSVQLRWSEHMTESVPKKRASWIAISTMLKNLLSLPRGQE